MFDEIFCGLLALDLDKLKKRAEEVAGYWDGESLKFVGADGNTYSDEDAQVMGDIIKVVKELEELLQEAGCRLDEYNQKRMELSAAAASLGGITSEKKRMSSRENGKKGGRPKKLAHTKTDKQPEV